MTDEGVDTPQAPQPSIDLIGLAGTMGRIEENQRATGETMQRLERAQVAGFANIDTKFQTVGEVQNEHSVALSGLKERVDAHDRIFEERKPIRQGWAVIAGSITGILAVIATVIAIFKP